MKHMAEIQLLREEMEAYYAHLDPQTEELTAGIAACVAGTPLDAGMERKIRQIEYLSEACPVHLFRHTPFFFEISSGRPRFSWGGLHSPVGTFLNEQSADFWLTPYADALKEDREQGFMHGWNNPVGLDHHCPGYDQLLSLGAEGIIRRAEEGLEGCAEEGSKEFYQAVIRCNRALVHLANRFAEEAKKLAEKAGDPEEKAHYEKIARTAQRIPLKPPESFFEALEMILFYRECAGTLEGIGFSTFAQLDRMLMPYYEKDLKEKRITKEEAEALLCDLLIYTEVRFDTANGYHETSTTMELGGCDRAGNVNFNEITRMILQCVKAVRSIGTKINCRISKNHPKEYLDLIAGVQLANLPCVMMHNDDVLIPARVKQGEAVEDARLYVGCGCHEVVLSNTEVCTRADTWINLPRIFLDTMEKHAGVSSFEALYAAFLQDAGAYHERIVGLKNAGEGCWRKYAPLPLYSSSLIGPLEKGKDVTEGGAQYNTTALSMLGAATLIDSLYCVKQLVFEEKRLSLPEFLQILQANYAGQEKLRQHIIRKIPRHGSGNEGLDDFSAHVLSDLSALSGQLNARGGKYLPAFYPHDLYRDLGKRTGATPDGRRAGMPLSRGVSPNEFIQLDSPLDIIHSLKKIDFTRFADSFIAEITLPSMPDTPENRQILTAIMEEFLAAEGSSIQFNLVDQAQLLEARKHPQDHPNLLVRVCGYSAAFIHLSEDTQLEILSRAVR